MGGKPRRWKFPGRVKIKGLWWDIQEVPPDHPELQCPRDGPLFGACEEGSRTIWVSNHLCAETRKDTVFHELVHACIRSNPISQGLPTDEERREEALVLFAAETAWVVLDALGWLRK